MGLLQTLVLEALSSYFPAVDTDSLRLNLLRGSLDLRDVELARDRVAAPLGLPFRLTSGSVAAIGIRVPWATLYSAAVKLDARGARFRFEEVPFSDRKTDVFKALRAARRGAKKRALAENERIESAITVALQKFVPMMLDRVETNVEDVVAVVSFVSGEMLRVAVEHIQTKPATWSRNRGDLAKTISVRGLSASLSRDSGSVVIFEKANFDLDIGFKEGLVSSHLRLSERVRLHFSLGILEFYHALTDRIALWDNAVSNSRPCEHVSENPLAWFRYAVRAVRRRMEATKPHISLYQLRDAIPSFLEYARLHVRRLRKEQSLDKDEELRVTDLEDSFSTETILWLRSHARAAAKADEVTAFAAKDWLSWALFDHKMSKDREQLAADLRKAIFVVDEYGTEEENCTSRKKDGYAHVMARHGKWSQAKLSITLESFSVFVVDDQQQQPVELVMDGVVLQAVTDASLLAYSASATIRDLHVLNGDIIVCQRLQGYQVNSPSTSSPPRSFLKLELQKSAFSSVSTISIEFIPVSVLLNSVSLSFYTQLATLPSHDVGSGFTTQKDAGTEKQFGSGASVMDLSPQQKENQTSDAFVVNINVPAVEMILENATNHSSALMMRCTSLSVCFRSDPKSPSFQGSCAASLQTCKLASHRVLSASAGKLFVEVTGTRDDLLSVSTTTTFIARANSMEMNLEKLDGFLTLAGIRIVMHTISCVTEVLDVLAPVSLWSRTKPTQSVTYGVNNSIRISIPTAHFRLQFEQQEEIPTHADFSIQATNIGTQRGGELSITCRNASMQVLGGNGFIRVTETSRHPAGLRIVRSAVDSEVPYDMELTFGFFDIGFEEVSLCAVVVTASRLAEIFDFKSRPDLDEGGKESFGSSSSDNRAGSGLRLSLLAHSGQIEVRCELSHILLAVDNFFIVQQGSVSSGSVDSLRLKDLSKLSGIHSVPAKSVSSCLSEQSERRALSFNLSSNSLNVYLHSLQLTILRVFVDRATIAIENLTAVIREAVNVGLKEEAGYEFVQKQSRSRKRWRMLSIQGSSLSIYLPSASTTLAGICLEAVQTTMTLAPQGLTFSLRKLSLLTNTEKVADLLPVTDQDCNAAPQWRVVMRAVDLELSRSSKTTETKADCSVQVRDEWNIQVHSRAAIFLTPSQIRLLRNFPTVLRSSLAETPSRRQTCAEQNEISSKHPINAARRSSDSFLTALEFIDLKVETQLLSMELLHEDCDGNIVSTCASLELYPVRAFYKKGIENSREDRETVVKTWALSSACIRMEDKSVETADRLREVIRRISASEQSPHVIHSDLNGEEDETSASFKCITREERREGARSSYELMLKNFRVVPAVEFFVRVAAFFEDSNLEPKLVDENYEPSVKVTNRPTISKPAGFTDAQPGSSGGYVKIDSSKIRSSVPAAKLSIKLVNSAILLSGRGRRVGDSALLIHLGSLKTSLLYASSGDILRGSQIRVRDVGVSMTWLPSAMIHAEHDASEAVDALGPQYHERTQTSERKRRVLNRATIPVSHAVPTTRHSLSVPRERLRWNFFRQEKSSSDWERLIFMRSGKLQFPARDSDRFVVIVPVIAIDTTVRSLSRLLYVLSVLDVYPEMKEHTDILLAPFHVSVQNLSVRLKVRTHRENFSPNPRLTQTELTIRLRSTINIVLDRNLSGFRGSLKISADAVNEQTGVRDQIFSPFTTEVKVELVPNISVCISSDELLRIILSPLTAEAIGCLVLPISAGERSQSERSHCEEKQAALQYKSSAETTVELTASFRSIALCCIGNEPQVQLLRLALRGLSIQAYLGLSSGAKSSLEILLQDLTLEDTMSWRLINDGQIVSDDVQWSMIVYSIREEEVSNSSLISSSARLLPKSLGKILLGRHGGGNYDGSTPSASTDSRLHSQKPPALCILTASWVTPLDHVSAHVRIHGLGLNIDMAIIPTLTQWAATIKDAIMKIETSFAATNSARPVRNRQQEAMQGKLRIRLDHMIVEPTNFTVALKAPASRKYEGWSQRALTYLLGSESASGISLKSPQIMINGDFTNMNQFVRRLRSTIASALASRYVGRQLLRQVPQVSRLGRVLALSYMRTMQKKDVDNAPGTLLKSMSVVPGHEKFGLRDALSKQTPDMMTHVRTASSSAFSNRSATAQKSESGKTESSDEEFMETIDLTSGDIDRVDNSLMADGRALFQELRRNDPRIPKNESFELHAPYEASRSLLVTSHYLIFVLRSSRTVIEKMIDRSEIAEYYQSRRRLTLVCVKRALHPVARKAARQQRRDTSSLASNVSRGSNVEEVTTYEIECASPEYAAWLQSQLPSPSGVIHELYTHGRT